MEGKRHGVAGVLLTRSNSHEFKFNFKANLNIKRNKSEYPTKMKREENWLLSIVPCS